MQERSTSAQPTGVGLGWGCVEVVLELGWVMLGMCWGCVGLCRVVLGCVGDVLGLHWVVLGCVG